MTDKKRKIIPKVLTASLMIGVGICSFTVNSCAAELNKSAGQEAAAGIKDGQNITGASFIKTTAEGFTLTSPNQKVAADIYLHDGQLKYLVKDDSQKYLEESNLGMTIDGADLGAIKKIEADSAPKLKDYSYDLNGKQSHVTSQSADTTLKITAENNQVYFLNVKVFNDGLAFQYDFSKEALKEDKVAAEENTSFTVSAGSTAWAGVDKEHYGNYESAVKEIDPAKKVTDDNGVDAGLDVALTVELPGDAGYTSILEGAAAPEFVGSALKAKGNNIFKIQSNWSKTNNTAEADSNFKTPWRIVAVGKTLDDIVNNTIVYSVNPEKDAALFKDQSDWVVPGRSAWSWLNGGLDKVTPENMRHYTELAAKLGFEYNTIDEGWVFWNGGNKSNYDEQRYKDQLTSIADFSKQYNVRQFLWNNITAMTGNMPEMKTIGKVNTFLDLLKETGMAGGKIDFWPSESSTSTIKLFEDTLKSAAEKKLLIDFHGSMKPTGMDRTYPNEVNREAIRGYEQVSYDENSLGEVQVPYKYYTTQPFTRYLQGHADFTPHVRSAGEIASLVFGDAPVNMISTDPDEILANDAVEMIKSVPTVWDKTYVFPESKIGEKTVIARENSGSWFIGGVNNSDAASLDLDLSQILGDGKYQLEMWKDTSEMDSSGAGGAKEKVVQTVTKDSKLSLDMIHCGGFIARIAPLSLSQYGGEITDKPIEVTAPNADSVVKYTLDGTDPAVSGTAVLYDTPISLTDSAKLTAAIVSGTGKGTTISHQFNKVTAGLAEKESLSAEIKDAEKYLVQTDVYTEETLNDLQQIVDKAQALADAEDTVPDQLTAFIPALQQGEKNLIRIDEANFVPVKDITVTAGSEQSGQAAVNAMDNDVSTLWHTSWDGIDPKDNWIQFDISEPAAVTGLKYVPRDSGSNGIAAKYKILAGDNASSLSEICSGEWGLDSSEKVVHFNEEQKKFKVIRLQILSAGTDGSGKTFGSAAEIRLLNDTSAESALVTSLKLGAAGIQVVKQGKTLNLSPAVTPEDAEGQISYTFSKEGIVSVDENGVLTALKPGMVKVAAKAGDKTAAVTVRVTQ